MSWDEYVSADGIGSVSRVGNDFTVFFGNVAGSTNDLRSAVVGTVVVVVIGALLLSNNESKFRRVPSAIVPTRRGIVGICLVLAASSIAMRVHGSSSELLLLTGVVGAVLPIGFQLFRRSDTSHRTIVIGDDPELIEDAVRSLADRSISVLSPILVHVDRVGSEADTTSGSNEADPTDGSIDAYATDVDWAEIGSDPPGQPFGTDVPVNSKASDGGYTTSGQSGFAPTADDDRSGPIGLRDVLSKRDVDTVVLSFRKSDRTKCFGTLRACHDLEVDVLAHERHEEQLLTTGDSTGDLVEVDLEPWGPIDRLLKRSFDVLVAGLSLLALVPVVLLIVLAIKFEGNGPVFFSQNRTRSFGDTFTIRKFRTLKAGAEVGTEIDEDRHTTLGRVLRMTHFDEIPQLWSILVGDMSVVGPRPAQTKLEPEFEAKAPEWRQRWFVKPGLTGLAQIHGATSSEPRVKLRYDLEYIRNQSPIFDLRILAEQIRTVVADVVDLLRD